MASPSDSFLGTCLAMYRQGLTPCDPRTRQSEGYKKLVEIAQSYFDKGAQEDFSLFGMEGQYYVQLWMAHLLFEYGKPDFRLKKLCLKFIQEYADAPSIDRFKKVAEEERQWLNERSLADQLVGIQRSVEIQSKTDEDYLEEVDIDIPLEKLLEIVTPLEDDAELIGYAYELSQDQLSVINNYLSTKIEIDLNKYLYFLTCTGIYD